MFRIITYPVIEKNIDKGQSVYLNVSTHPLNFGFVTRALLRSDCISLVSLMHDIIPITHPEYVPAIWSRRLEAVIENLNCNAAGVIANSAHTAASLASILSPRIPIQAVPLGVDMCRVEKPRMQAPWRDEAPYFICVGTIEPRKNHITLLHVWRQLEASLGPETPRLLIVGRQGWESDHVMKLLTCSPALRRHVRVLGWLRDAEMTSLMRNARALLMPSFVEGFGLPIAEALALGVPVICSDIPAHREIGRETPAYVSSIDGKAWLDLITDYATPESRNRDDQLRRLKSWQPQSWSMHVHAALNFIDKIVSARGERSASMAPLLIG
jgi:glycosyltransferase involved in cell wall biosynthesis